MLNGKIAIVTGGTRGIGLAVVRTFLHNGAKVALFGSRETSVQRALAQLREEQPDWPVMGRWPDLTDYAAVERAVQEVAQTFGGVDILVNNAGISAREPLGGLFARGVPEHHGPECHGGVPRLQGRRADHARSREGLHHQHQLHGQPLWSAERRRLSHQQICRQRPDAQFGAGAWPRSIRVNAVAPASRGRIWLRPCRRS